MIIEGTIEDIVYKNEENGYTVINVDCNNVLTTAVGKFPPIQEGERVELEGNFTKSKYGDQFSVQSVKVLPPNTTEAIKKYLSSGLIRGVGEVTASNIVNKFKGETFYVIEYCPQKLTEVRGVSIAKAMQISDAYMEIKKMQNSVMFIQQYGLTTNMALKIYNFYKDKSEQVLRENPYKLTEDIDGIGFFTADKIAIKMGIDPNSEFRFRAAILHCLKENSDKNGNTFIFKKQLFNSVADVLQINDDFSAIYERVISTLLIDGVIKIFIEKGQECAMLSKYFFVERNIAEKLLSIKQGSVQEQKNVDKDISQFEKLNNLTLHEKQKQAIDMAVNNGVCVITGGPGTGKTTIIKCIIHCLKQQGKTFLLLAPTGRASKRLNESTGEFASTIHRALDLDFKNGNGVFFTKNEQNPLQQNCIIVDEASMIDAQLMHYLLKAIKRTAKLIIVGDKDQLPSVGAGNVLADILKSETLPVVNLTEIYRQEANSLIIDNAHLINNGEMPILDNTSKDFFFETAKEQEEIMQKIIDLQTERIANYLHMDPFKIQVLAPMKSGACGTIRLNKELQAKLNPPSQDKSQLEIGSNIFRVGDKVMQIANNYEKEWHKEDLSGEKGVGVFNGDIGYIRKISKASGEIEVHFDDGRICTYIYGELADLVLSYAVTIHKSQGSEFDVVLIPVIAGAPIILTRNLLYTAVTRAKRMVVLVGTKYNLKRMVDNNYTAERFTRLCHFLKEAEDKVNFLYKN